MNKEKLIKKSGADLLKRLMDNFDCNGSYNICRNDCNIQYGKYSSVNYKVTRYCHRYGKIGKKNLLLLL